MIIECKMCRKCIDQGSLSPHRCRHDDLIAEVWRLREQLGIERELLADTYREIKILILGNVSPITMRIERRMDAWKSEGSKGA